MKTNIFRFFLSALLFYLVNSYTHYFLEMPNGSLIGMSSFLPPLLGIMWGPIAAFGSLVGALLTEYTEWLILPQVLQEKGTATCLWQGVLLFCNCGLWAFIAAYMPYRLGYSLLVNPEKPLFTLRVDFILKFICLMFITNLTTSLFLAMTTTEEDMIRLLEGLQVHIGTAGEYALTIFLNDFDASIFCGLMWFFFLASVDYPFYRPTSVIVPKPKLQRTFDVVFVLTVLAALFLCQANMVAYEGWRFAVGLLLCVYMFRPLSPMPKESSKHEKLMQKDDINISRKIAALFYVFILIIFIVLDVSGVIYGLNDMNIWRQFNAECVTMINIALIALLCMLLRYHNSIMTNIVMLEVVTVFISAFALGGVGFMVTNRIMTNNVEKFIEEMSVLSRERLERTFNNIQISVNDIHDLALAELESYELLTTDETWRNNYLRRTEHLFRAIASNTDGSVAFYFRLSPEFAGPLGGFSWGREKNHWEGAAPSFYQRMPVDLSKYAPTDFENVGWYYIPIARHNNTWIEPYIDPTINSYVISYVSPLYVDDKLVGIVGMDIDFDYLIHEIRRMSVYNYGFIYLIDRNNRVLYHRKINQGEMFKPNPDYREIETYLTNGIWIGIAVSWKSIYLERNNLLMHFVTVMLIVTMLASFFSIYLASRGIRPLLILTEAAQKIASGNLNVKLPAESKNELGTLVKSIREMVSKLEIYVYRDKLTGLSNTAAYARKCNAIANLPEEESKYAVIVFDVNFLKKVNDNYGHEAGNELIKSAANIISNTFKDSSAFRIGGDEFVVVLEDKDYDQRDELLAKFDKSIAEKHFTMQDEDIKLSVARGMSVWRKGVDYPTVFQEADESMYAHKTDIKKKLGITDKR